MTENIWLMVLGLILIIFELLFGAISGFDIALIGLSLIMGGLVHYFGASWQLGIVVAIVIILAYFVYFRRVARKKLLITTQKIGIEEPVYHYLVTGFIRIFNPGRHPVKIAFRQSLHQGLECRKLLFVGKIRL